MAEDQNIIAILGENTKVSEFEEIDMEVQYDAFQMPNGEEETSDISPARMMAQDAMEDQESGEIFKALINLWVVILGFS